MFNISSKHPSAVLLLVYFNELCGQHGRNAPHHAAQVCSPRQNGRAIAGSRDWQLQSKYIRLSVCSLSASQLRVSAIRLMHIVMETKPEAFMETDGLKDARTRCISLFFKSLTSRADQVLML